MQKTFPEVALHLENALSTFAKGKRSMRQALMSVASTLKVSIDTVDSWRRGVRCIPKDKIEPLVRALRRGNSGGDLTIEELEWVSNLEAARQKDEVVLSWRERVEEGHIALRVKHAQYEGAGEFWERIFLGFLDAADVCHKAAEGGPKIFHELQDDVWQGRLDVALGLLATPRLSLKLWFFNSPICYRLNCVILRESVASHGISKIHEALADPERRKHFFIPIVMKGEVGEAHACNNLGLTGPIWVESLSAKKFCYELDKNQRGGDGRIPLAFADEITCLSILAESKGQAQLVFPLLPDMERCGLLKPPSFPLGLCLSRNERLGHAKKSELMGFVRDALPTYIACNAQSIALFYLELRRRIRVLLDSALPEAASAERDEWVARTFRLSSRWLGLEPPYWRAVLLEAIALSSREDNTFQNHLSKLSAFKGIG